MNHVHTYELPIARGYVSHWGMREAVRELIQNGIDSESPFEYEFGEDALTLRSRHSTLSPQSLLLGATSKAESVDKIGQFGEGYKLALLALTRADYSVVVHNGDRTWKPKFRRSRAFKADVLCIDESTAITKTEGLAFEVRGLSPGDIEIIRESCLQMQNEIGEVYHVPQGRILLSRPGKLYVGGLYVCDTEMQFGYDVNPKFLRLERDRQTVDSFDLEWLTKDMWFASGRWEQIAALIEAGAPDLRYAEHGCPELVKEACYKLFTKRNPNKVVAKDQRELERLVKNGMPAVIVRENFYKAVTGYAGALRAPPAPLPLTPAQMLNGWLSEHGAGLTQEARGALTAIIESAKGWSRL